MGQISPLQEYCSKIDFKYYDKTYGWYYYDLALKRVRPEFITNLLLKDFEWRGQHQQNILASAEGQQGSGKSLFCINLAIWSGKFFGNPFILERDIFSNPYALDQELRNNGEFRRTFLYDEQPRRMVGMGSMSTRISLQDYEEIGRYTQKNIFYCSPELRDHSHYFVFKQVDYDINRVTNQICKSCPKYVECHFKQYETLCEIPFFERDGYPKEFRFMLYTKRLADQIEMPRGIVSFPMVHPNTALAYDKIKKENITSFENYENNAWEMKKQMINQFIDDNASDLTQETTTGEKVKSRELIKAKLFDVFGQNRFLKEEIDLFVSMTADELGKRIRQKE